MLDSNGLGWIRMGWNGGDVVGVRNEGVWISIREKK